MSELATVTEATRVPTPRGEARDCPPTAPPGFFSQRRWSWRSGNCAAVDHRFEVMSEEPFDLGPLMRPVTTPLRAPADGRALGRYRIVRRRNEAVPYALYYDYSRLLLSRTPEAVLRFLSWHVNRQAIDHSSVRHVVLHAAAATRAGITLILPGDQERGKTTTVAGLLREGYDYVTDEAVAINPRTLCITPFPKALSLDDGSWPLFPECRPVTAPFETRQWQVPAESLGSRSLRCVVRPPRIIVFPHFVAGSATRSLTLSKSEAVRELAQATFHFEDQPARNLHTLGALVRSATAARLRIGSLDEAVLAIERLVSQALMEEL